MAGKPLDFRIAFVVTVFGMAGLLFSAVFALHWSTQADARPIVLEQPPEQALANAKSNVNRVSLPPTMSMADQLQIARGLDSDDSTVRSDAVEQIRTLEYSDKRSFAIGLPQWIVPLLKDRQYADLENFAVKAVLERPFDAAVVAASQRGRVLAFMAEGRFPQALKEAKAYYNVAPLSATADAVNLLKQILLHTADSSTADNFEAEQGQAGVHSAVLDSIRIDTKPYATAVLRQKSKLLDQNTHTLYTLLALGNLMLLTDNPGAAEDYFQRACKQATRGGKSLAAAIEGVARAIRDTNRNVAAADAFVTSVRQNPELSESELTDGGLPPVEELRIAAQHIALSKASGTVLPSLEQEREGEESAAIGSISPPRIVTGFEGSTPVYVTAISPTHLVVEITTSGFRDWFMFRVLGAAGKTIRIDITGAYKTVPNWSQKAWSLNPVYSYATSLDDPAFFTASPVSGEVIASNGPILPQTTGQSWHYISQVWSDSYTLSCVLHFDADSAYVAMRVPRTPAFNDRYLHGLESISRVKVIQIGKSSEGRPLLLAEIGEPRTDRPCILIYAGEHADEQDAGWVAQGALEYLLSDSPGAAHIRQHFTFLVIPMLDPDASAAGIHESIIYSFLAGRTTAESNLYANWFQKWVNAGNRLDLAVDLHNVQSAEGPHIFCPLLESAGKRGAESLDLHWLINRNMQAAGYGVRSIPPMRGWMPDRLGGWLARYYGSLDIPYEVNSQAPERHLSLAEIKSMGAVLVGSISQYFDTNTGIVALADVDARRRDRAARWSGMVPSPSSDNAIESEAKVLNNALQGTDTALSLERTIP